MTRRLFAAMERLWRRVSDPLPRVPPPPATSDRAEWERWLAHYRARLAAKARRKGAA